MYAQVCLITNPIWVVKTRLQLQRRRHISALQAAGPRQAPAVQPYRGFLHAVGHIGRHEGLAGFYRGLGPSLIMVKPPAVLCACGLAGLSTCSALKG